MSNLRAGLIGSHISRTRLPDALRMMSELDGRTLEFDLIDTAHLTNFDLAATVDGLRDEGWDGVTVTHPYKTQAAEYVFDGMEPDVAHLGACNTLVFGKDIKGFNTDFTGFLSAWHAVMGNASPGRVVMAGAGGVARALGPALVELGATELVIWDKDMELAHKLAARIGGVAKAVPEDDAQDAICLATGLVNATPMGMKEYPGSAFQPDHLISQGWAFDAVYTPPETEFLIAARDKGITTMSGFELFRHMAVKSYEAYTGATVEAEPILEGLSKLRPN